MIAHKRVVVTGMGVVSPLGSSISTLNAALKKNLSGISLIQHFDTTEYPVKFAGLVKDFHRESVDYDQKILSKLDDVLAYGIEAAIQAVNASQIHLNTPSSNARIGVILGSGIGGLQSIEQQKAILSEKGPKRISPFFIPGTISNMMGGLLAIKYGFLGPNFSTATACSSGTHCIGQGYDCIQLGLVDAVIVGASEKASTPLGLAGFAAARALSTRNEAPEKASRPWDKARDGFVLSDGAAALVIEEYEHARARGAPILAELVGVGYSCDAHHMTQPHPEAKGAILSMEMALKRAGLSPDNIDYINAHGTSTPLGDLIELQGILKIFGDHAKKLAISSTKSMTGHLLGASGALEAVICVLSLIDQYVPATINLDDPEELCEGLNLVAHHLQERSLTHVLSNSFGFGGTNGSLIFKKFD
jgi:3-oxoacyl-[acyl-carrier-protein] synthase II